MSEERTCVVCKDYIGGSWGSAEMAHGPLKKFPFAMGTLCGFWRCESCGLVYFWPDEKERNDTTM